MRRQDVCRCHVSCSHRACVLSTPAKQSYTLVHTSRLPHIRQTFMLMCVGEECVTALPEQALKRQKACLLKPVRLKEQHHSCPYCWWCTNTPHQHSHVSNVVVCVLMYFICAEGPQMVTGLYRFPSRIGSCLLLCFLRGTRSPEDLIVNGVYFSAGFRSPRDRCAACLLLRLVMLIHMEHKNCHICLPCNLEGPLQSTRSGVGLISACACEKHQVPYGVCVCLCACSDAS